MERALQLNPIFKEEKVMVRAAEQTSTTNPVAERRFDSRVIFAFVAGGILLLLVFGYVGSRLFSYEETVSPGSNTQPRTQENDKRAAP